MGPVSKFRNTTTTARILGKSPARLRDIPVLGRLSAETYFDRHWMVEVAVSFSLCRPVFRQSSDDAMRGAGGNPADLLFKETDGKCIAEREVPFSGKKSLASLLTKYELRQIVVGRVRGSEDVDSFV